MTPFDADPERPRIKGPLAELLQQQTETGRRVMRQARGKRLSGRRVGNPSRTHFLSELEVCGNAAEAAASAGCTLDQVRAWRASDPMFERDYVLALAAHLRTLTRIVREVAGSHESPLVREAARAVLDSEGGYVGADGRLDARAWRDALARFIHSRGLDVAAWEPKVPSGQEPAQDAS